MGRSPFVGHFSAAPQGSELGSHVWDYKREEDEQIISFISVDEEGGEGGSYVSFDLYNPLGRSHSLPLTSPLKVPLTPLLCFSSLL